MTKPRPKNMLLVAVAIAAPGGALMATSACGSSHFTGFTGDIAYDGGYEPTGSFEDASPTPRNDAAADGEADASEADAATDASEAGDGGG